MTMQLRSIWFWVSLVLLALLAVFLLYPVVNIFYASLGSSNGASTPVCGSSATAPNPSGRGSR